MSLEIRERLRKQRGTPVYVYVYSGENFTLLYVFESKQHMYNLINIHHTTLNDCLTLGTLYLPRGTPVVPAGPHRGRCFFLFFGYNWGIY